MATSSKEEIRIVVHGPGRDREAPSQPPSQLPQPPPPAVTAPPLLSVQRLALGLASKGSNGTKGISDLPALSRLSSRHRLGAESEQSQAERGECVSHSPLPNKIRARLNYGERQQRRRATSSLLLGTIFGGLGFFTAAWLGIYRTWFSNFHEENFQGLPFPSGNPYWPGSVSEMVNNPLTPHGKVWFAFETIAALAIWNSWYPWELRNVYVGGGVKLLGCCLPFLHARTMVPPIGLLMLVMIPIGSPGQIDFTTDVASWIHLIGAVLMIGGHGLFEFYTLSRSGVVHIQPRERILRWIFCLGCIGCGVLFLVWGNVAGSPHICCADVRRVPTDADIALARSSGHTGLAAQAEMAQDSGERLLYDSASGLYLTFKFLAYWCEVSAGLFMIAGLFTIWYYCPERHLDLFDELPGEYADDGAGSEGSTEGTRSTESDRGDHA
eukprot:CAMPEP_0115266066 /NCGR_PEP_ID=MMETSP0270-20121206/51273_1 /TAXON_ID=71861 /ORGANISM="Scrippsiella trochoidea, Strain CCMP3099" /LENGTH=438 /DNA_ID=CAMNT_0002682145 /DNA_START=85 /DNA_END=1401 /DNA_ORIENTATION=+